MTDPGNELSRLLGSLGPELLSLLSGKRIELERVELAVEELELFLPIGGYPAGFMQHPAESEPQVPLKEKPTSLIPESFQPVPEKYPCTIREVTLGATRTEGGSRDKTITIGGSGSPPYTFPGSPPAHPPVISVDVFDTRVPMPRALKAHISEVIDDPAAWAELNVQNGADMVTVHLLSTDRLLGDASAKEASKTVEEVLQAVSVPLIIGGCGDPKKDAETFIEIAAMAEGERLVLNSVTTDMADQKTLEPVAKAADTYGHCLLAFTGLDLNSAKELNRRLYQFFPADRILMDLTTVAPGYGLEYSFSIHERARMAAIMGDDELRHPTISACTNAWSAREAWMDLGPGFGRPEIRGPLFESVTAAILSLAGIDLFLMMHPFAISTMREISGWMLQESAEKPVMTDGADWRRARI